MNALEQVALAGQALWRTLRRMGTGRLWVPWLVLGLVQVLVLLALLSFARPAAISPVNAGRLWRFPFEKPRPRS